VADECSTYAKVRYRNVYPGIDLIYYGNRRQLEYDFVIAPGSSPRAIRLKIEGADRVRLNRQGDLVLAVSGREVIFRKPSIYQLADDGQRKQVEGSYSIKGHQVGFRVNRWDANKALVIDPVLSCSTYFGPSADALAIAIDVSGNAYITGSATAGNFPTTAGSFKPVVGSDTPDAFVTKLNSTGTALVYSTFLGGNGQDVGNSIAVDSSGNAYIAGRTNSTNFPTVNPIRSSTSNFLKTADTGAHWNGQVIGPAGGAINVLAVDPLAPNTIYAGTGQNGGGGVYKTTDGGNNWTALNTGLTSINCSVLLVDPNTPSTIYASLNTTNGSAGSGLYKSIDGGNSWSALTNGLTGVSALAIDPSSPSTLYAGSAFIGVFKSTNGGASWAGASTGINFGGLSAIAVDPQTPATVYASAGGGGVFKTTNGGANWGQVNSGLTNTTIRLLKIDSASNVYAGSAGGGLFKSTNGGGNWNPLNNGLPTFITVSSLAFNPASPTTLFMGSADGRIYRSIDGGSNWSTAYETLTRTSFNALAINPGNSAIVLAGANTEASPLNDSEAFVSKLSADGSALVYSTYLGGGNNDTATGIAVDATGKAYVTGQTSSPSFPIVSAFQSTLKGTSDAFVTSFSPNGDVLTYSTFLGDDGFEAANGIATDAGGNAYVTGNTNWRIFRRSIPFRRRGLAAQTLRMHL
jgi:photosystem II stability/assembly factor-like uncharacterized protein